MFLRAVWLGLQALLALSCSTGIAGAQSTIHICGADLRIGMAKDRVLEITSSGCELKSLHTLGTEVWCARPPENKSNDPDDYEGCHVLQFVNSALSAVNKDISQASGETFADLMNKVYEFTTDAQAVGKTVVIRASHTEEEKQRLRTISISARDGHDLALVIVQAVGGRGWTSQVRLVEILGPTPKPAGALPKKQ